MLIVARKTQGDLTAQRNAIRREYKRGPRKEQGIRGDQVLSAIERRVFQMTACYLKAQGYSYTYMADAFGVSPSTVKNWFLDEELNLAASVEKISKDFTQGAIKLGKTYLIEIIETLMEIFRTTSDEAIATKIGFEMLDRFGITKVNKSESAVSTRSSTEVELVDKVGLLAHLDNASPEDQAAAAEAMETLLGIGMSATPEVVPESDEVATNA